MVTKSVISMLKTIITSQAVFHIGVLLLFGNLIVKTT